MYSRKKIKLRASRFWCMQYPYAWITQSKIECNWVPKNHRGTKWWPARRAATVKVLICKRARARLPKACLLTSRRASALFGVPIWSHAVAVWNQEVQNQSSAEISGLILSPYWSRNDPIYQVIFSTVLVPYKMHAESWELDLNSEFRVLTSWISLTLSSTIQNACNNKNDLKVGIDFQCSMNMVPKCRAQFMHDWIPAVLSARTRDCRRRPDLIARAENHNSTQPGCHVASRTRSTDLQKMTWYFRSFPVRG